MKKVILLLSFAFCFSAISFAQVRPVETNENKTVRPAPASFAAKYEGGMFGFNDNEEGTLKFDDENKRIVFFGKDGKEKFAIPFTSMLIVYPQSKKVNSTTTNVIKNLPLPGAGIAGLIKDKRKYLVINFDDPDVDAKGTVNFRLDDKDLLDSVVAAIAEKAKLVQRGDAYFRPRAAKTTTTDK